MGLDRLFSTPSIEQGITTAHHRRYRFRISRVQSKRGLLVYILENTARGERIYIPQDLFDLFRSEIFRASLAAQDDRERRAYRRNLFFRTQKIFSVVTKKSQPKELSVSEHRPFNGSTGSLSVPWDGIGTLSNLLFNPELKHRFDLLERIITYHQLFQFSFADESRSMTSDLILRKDVLCETAVYHPSLGKRSTEATPAETAAAVEGAKQERTSRPPGPKQTKSTFFRSRLAEKDRQDDYAVNYEQLFQEAVKQPESRGAKSGDTRLKVAAGDEIGNCVQLPLIAGDIKEFSSKYFRCEFGIQQIKEMRRQFLAARDCEYFVGFEILDCIFRKGKGLRTYRFPLYYLPVTLEESGRHVELHPRTNRVLLNHLGLANLVETFSKSRNSQETLANFFKTLLNQKFEIDGDSDRLRITRLLPFHEEIYTRIREILIGFPGEQGKGGLLGDLKVASIECDLEATQLYRSPRPTTPTVWALDHDLDDIATTSHQQPKLFFNSLLGRVLSPSRPAVEEAVPSLDETLWFPGPQPKSTRLLIERLNSRNLVLLEGPPGTGKTYTIANLIIHCIASGKRLLVVSDRRSAIQALLERLTDYLVGDDRTSTEAKQLSTLWAAGVKAIDQIPDHDTSLAEWTRQLREMLGVDRVTEVQAPARAEQLATRVQRIDARIDWTAESMSDQLARYFNSGESPSDRVTPKGNHPRSEAEIAKLLVFIEALMNGSCLAESDRDFCDLVDRFIADRDQIHAIDLAACSHLFDIPGYAHWEEAITQLHTIDQWLDRLIDTPPRGAEQWADHCRHAPDRQLAQYLTSCLEQALPDRANASWNFVTRLKRRYRHPLMEHITPLKRLLAHHIDLLSYGSAIDNALWVQLKQLHKALFQEGDAPPLVLELGRFAARMRAAEDPLFIHQHLEKIAELQQQRDGLVRQQLLSRLFEIAARSQHAAKSGNTSPLTTILSLLDSLESYESLASGWPVLEELQQLLFDTFPVWLCRKRAVSFLFPCEAKCFDLVIVDEATQCRVDDALPLLFRAKKLMVVGDEKQTVLAKDSALDDFLFRAFDLDEYLRTSGARGVKVGGSHLFGLVKRIKQASVMLDEHYRCAPEIIEYSNRYVYENELKIMQWTMKDTPPAVVVDYSEAQAPPSERAKSGKFRGIETQMVDRFLDFISGTIRALEREFGKKIDMNKEVALCYFLLKNGPYFDNVKGEFLARLRRGEDVLDGAGAALQGKEREFIFYLWDINKSNMKFFKQGDDPAKRKGELNVLMSRPKIRAFHFLHRDFKSLPHAKASITDYLWRKYISAAPEIERRPPA